MIAETNQFRFPLASAKRGLADDAGRPGSRRSTESSCCVSGKQQQEPWAQFTHTWHPARLQGIALGAGAAAGAGPSEGSAANAIQAGSALSRKRPGSLGWGPRLQRWTLTPQTDRTRDKEALPPEQAQLSQLASQSGAGPALTIKCTRRTREWGWIRQEEVSWGFREPFLPWLHGVQAV